MKFVKDERMYFDLTNKEIEKRNNRLKKKIKNLEDSVETIQKKVRKLNL